MEKYELLKIAIDTARRMFGLTVARALVGQTPKIAGGAGKAVEQAYGLGTDLVSRPAIRLLKATRATNSTMQNIAKARLYRVNRVNGASKEEATRALGRALAKQKVERAIEAPFRKARRLIGIKEGADALQDKITSFGSIKESAKKIGKGFASASKLIKG